MQTKKVEINALNQCNFSTVHFSTLMRPQDTENHYFVLATLVAGKKKRIEPHDNGSK